MREKTVRKWFWVWDYEKEEQWLNAMAMEGWTLVGVGFCTYRFRADAPGAYTVRMEMHPPEAEYLRFMEETGAEYIGRIGQWLFFRKKTEEGAFEIFSDLDSRISHLERCGKVLTAVGAVNLGIGVISGLGADTFGWVNLLCAAAVMYGLGRIHGKKETLMDRRRLTET